MTTDQRRDAMASLVQAHQAGVWRYLRFLGCNSTEADDLTQETFLALFGESFEERSPAQTASYLRTVARHRLLTVRRRQKGAPTMIDLQQADAVWDESAGDDGLSAYLDALRECLEQTLSPRVRQALDLHYRDQVSRSELAAQLDLAVEGVKTLLRRARSTLRDCVQRKTQQ